MTSTQDYLAKLQAKIYQWSKNAIQVYGELTRQPLVNFSSSKLQLAEQEHMAQARQYINQAKNLLATRFAELEKKYLAILVELSAELRCALRYYSGKNWQQLCQTAPNELEQTWQKIAADAQAIFKRLQAKTCHTLVMKFFSVLDKWQLAHASQLDTASLTSKIKQQYKKLAVQLHPDLNPADPIAATADIQALNEEYAFLQAVLQREDVDFSAMQESTDQIPTHS